MFDLNATPRLETERLVLRGWQASDLDGFAEMMAHPECARFLTADQRPVDRTETWNGIAMFIGHWALRGYGLFVVEEKGSGAFVGRVGPWQPEGWIGFEIGWGIAREFWGRGYAYEAARAAGSWALANYPLEKLMSLIHDDNTRSQGLARRLGMAPARPTLHAGMPHTIWEIPRAAWEAG